MNDTLFPPRSLLNVVFPKEYILMMLMILYQICKRPQILLKILQPGNVAYLQHAVNFLGFLWFLHVCLDLYFIAHSPIIWWKALTFLIVPLHVFNTPFFMIFLKGCIHKHNYSYPFITWDKWSSYIFNINNTFAPSTVLNWLAGFHYWPVYVTYIRWKQNKFINLFLPITDLYLHIYIFYVS